MKNVTQEYQDALNLVRDTLRIRREGHYSEFLGQRVLHEFCDQDLIELGLCDEGGRRRTIRDLDGVDHDITYVARINLNVLDVDRVSREMLLLNDGLIWKFENKPGKKDHFSGLISPQELGAFLLELPDFA